MDMTVEQLWLRLSRGEIVSLERGTWEALRPSLEVVEEHDTQMRGMLLIVRGPTGLAAVEEPDDSQRVVRALASPAAAEVFVADRLATYERMWDGCGCRVDYFN